MGGGNHLRVNSGSIDSKGAAKDNLGASTGCVDGISGVAVETLVELTSGYGGTAGQVGPFGDSTDPRSDNGPEQGEATSGVLHYGAAVVQAVRDERHRPGMAFVVEECRFAGLSEKYLTWWLDKMGDSTRRKRLHGWRMWQDYCMENEYGPAEMWRFKNVVMVVSEFLASLEVVDTPLYLIKEALTAVKAMFEIVNASLYQQLNKSQMIGDVLRASTTGVKKVSKYRTIWKLEILLDYIQKGPPSERLDWFSLMARAAAVFMIFIPCRPIGTWRIDPGSERRSEDGKSVEVQAKEKTNHGKGTTALILRAGPSPNLCPLTVYRILKSEAVRKGLVDTLWGSKSGVPYKQASALSRLLKGLLCAAGVPSQYAAYSIRHALITALFDRGLKETEVNAYTGHSNNARTALTHYFHLDDNWVGKRLLEGKEMEMSDSAAQLIQRDNLLLQSELHEGEMDTEGGE
jgi:hypothetical protein